MGKRKVPKIEKDVFDQKSINVQTIVGWNRLEPRSRSENFSRSLKAEVRDALWMLTRQWQMGEFKGEDAGSPIDARIMTTEYTINRYSVKNGEAVEYSDTIPLETKVERENISDSIYLRIQISTQFSKIISSLNGKVFITKVKENYSISDESELEMEKILCNQESLQLFEQAKFRSINGYKLINDIKSGKFDLWVNSLSDTIIPPTGKSILKNAGKDLLNWYQRLYNEPDPLEESSWSTPYLEYQFKNSATISDDEQVILKAEQYTSGHLDWYSFDIDKSNNKLKDKTTVQDIKGTENIISFIPAPISFGGMPNARYWEMEDQKTDFGSIDANTTDIVKLIIAEFGLICSNDWFILPYSMETGKICKIKELIVTDTFGDRKLIRAAGNGVDDDWQSWRVFNMSISGTEGNADMKLLLTPSIIKVLQSEPLEKINLIRDEMANMVWGVESIVTLPSGTPKNGFEAANELSKYLTDGITNTTNNLDASVKYTLGSTVPENWIPFVSVHVDDRNRQIKMQRASMPRVSDGSNISIKPRTTILNEKGNFYIHEEEVPRSGTIVTKSFQRTRWYNGKVILWLGRKVTNGKGEGNSGLNFDQIKNI